MTYIPILFNQGIDDLRRIGARGGHAHARNWRARRRAMLNAPARITSAIQPPQETTAEAVALLDAQFPWLRGAERRCSASRR